MNGSILISGGNKESREKKIISIVNKEEEKNFEEIQELENKPDILNIKLEKGEKSIGISKIREGINFLREKPLSYKKKFLIIQNSEKMTVQSQNSLLKTLEEPPSKSIIILSARNHNFILDTIVSRCRLINIKEDEKEYRKDSKNPSLKEIIKMDLGKRLDLCSEISKEEREDVINMLENWIREGREDLLKNPRNISLLENISKIIEIKNDLENSNVNLRLSLEALLLNLS
jgi:DNA polymerase-3 subunit delta'